MKTFKTLLLIIAIIYSSNAQTLVELSYDAYLSNSVTIWQNVEEKADKAYNQNKSEEALFDLALVQYGLLNACISNQNEEIFDEYVDELENNLDKLIKKDFRKHDALALKSAVFGYKIAFSSWKGMFLGPKSSALIEEALELDKSSYIVQKMYASNQYFTPEMWGGNSENAINAFGLSIAKLEQQGMVKNWMYLDNLAWLGIVYSETGQPELAEQTWIKSLEVESDFNWVSKVLLPNLKESR
jgi:hypothetical protein